MKFFRPVSVKDADGTTIGYTERTYATYSYNAWGELIGITDSNGNSILNKQTTSTALANLNPLRYRGYYYDNETGFYYLQSRYYDPANHRFINADVFTSTDETNAIACNMFAYCNNNPAMYFDFNGEDAILIIDNDAASENGHVCTLIQDDSGNWYYYSFASARGTFTTVASLLFGGYVRGVLVRTPLSGTEDYDLHTLEGVRDFLYENGNAPKTANAMDGAIYIEGDFSESNKTGTAVYDYMNSNWNDWFTYSYNLLDYNCMHFSLMLLSKSNAFSTSQREILQNVYDWGIRPNKQWSNLCKLGVELK